MRRVLAAATTDSGADAVLALAQAIAPLFGATTDAVQPPGGGRGVRAVAETRGVPLRQLDGNAVARLAIEAADDEVVAVVCGGAPAAGAGARDHLALAMADTLDKPIVVVPPASRVLTSVERVLVAIKGTPTRAVALKRAVELTEAAGLDMLVVHVDDETSVPSFSDQVQYEGELYAQEFLTRFVPGAPRARLALRIGAAADQILAVADEHDADLIAVGWPHTSAPERGSVARAVIEGSRVPVMLVATTPAPGPGRTPPGDAPAG